MANNNIFKCLLFVAICLFGCNSRSVDDTKGLAPKDTKAAPLKPKESTVQKIVRISNEQVGVEEVTENFGGQITVYLASCGIKHDAYWCAAKCNWVHIEAGADHPKEGAAYCPNWFVKERRYWFKGDEIDKIRLGTEAGFYFPELGRIAHIGTIVEIKKKDNIVIVNEGNTKKDKDSRNGTVCLNKMRQLWAIKYMADWTNKPE
jgi:hypothetical protein